MRGFMRRYFGLDVHHSVRKSRGTWIRVDLLAVANGRIVTTGQHWLHWEEVLWIGTHVLVVIRFNSVWILVIIDQICISREGGSGGIRSGLQLEIRHQCERPLRCRAQFGWRRPLENGWMVFFSCASVFRPAAIKINALGWLRKLWLSEAKLAIRLGSCVKAMLINRLMIVGGGQLPESSIVDVESDQNNRARVLVRFDLRFCGWSISHPLHGRTKFQQVLLSEKKHSYFKNLPV